MQPQESAPDDHTPRPRRHRKIKIMWVGMLVLGAAAWWLNGPGFRWLAPKIAARMAAKAGASLSFDVEGSLSGGFSIHDLQLSDYKSLASLTVRKATPDYRLGGLLHRQIRGLAADDVQVEIQARGTNKSTADRQALDLTRLGDGLRRARAQLVPLALELDDVAITVKRGEAVLWSMAPSQVRHAAGSDTFELELGDLTDAGGRMWPAPHTSVLWTPEELVVEALDPAPGVGVRDLVLRLPRDGGPSADAEIHVDEAVLYAAAGPGFETLTLDLREGRLPVGEVLGRFMASPPLAADVTSLSVNVENFLPEPRAATGAARLLLENARARGIDVPELSVDLGLGAEQATVAATGRGLEGGFAVHAAAPVRRDDRRFDMGDIDGSFEVRDTSRVLAALARYSKVLDPKADLPDAALAGSFHVPMAALRPQSLHLSAKLTPRDPDAATAMVWTLNWQADQPLAMTVKADGLAATIDVEPSTLDYQGSATFDHFTSARIDPWLALVKADTRGAYGLTTTWHGGGNVRQGKHHGELAGVDATWRRADGPPVVARGAVSYRWPGFVAAKPLRLQVHDQAATADLRLAEGLLEINGLRWEDRGVEVAGGSARLPVPADLRGWRETLARDTRPLTVTLQSKVVSLALLKDWLPAAAKLDPRSTGFVELQVSGSYAEPIVDARVELKNLHSPEQPKLPPAGLTLVLTTKDGVLHLSGSATAPDYPAAAIAATLPFRPAAWAEEPELLAEEPLTARAEIPRIDLSRFSALVPGVNRLSGQVHGRLEATGKAGRPVLAGEVSLSGGGVELKSRYVPPVTGVRASVSLTTGRVELNALRATIAAGTVEAGGTLTLDQGKPGVFDLRASARHLPVVRNESLIVRASAELKLTGPWQEATVSGTVGVVDSLFYRDIELLPIGTPFTTPSAADLPRVDTKASPAAGFPEPFRNWKLACVVRTEEPFLIRGNFATGRITGNVPVGGTLADPRPNGELKITNATALLPFTTLTVREGYARFTPETGFDPELELRGVARPRPYLVNVYIYGRASDPQMLLTSNPPLPENEIMTLLATGTTAAGLEDPQVASTRALQLLAEELRRGRFGVGRRLRPLLKLLDKVEFTLGEQDPYTSESYTSATLSLTDRWFLSAGMGAEGDTRVMAIWRLTFR